MPLTASRIAAKHESHATVHDCETDRGCRVNRPAGDVQLSLNFSKDLRLDRPIDSYATSIHSRYPRSLVLLGACGKTPKLPAIAPGQVVLAFGDSVTCGTGAAPGEDWPKHLAAQTGWQIINAGIPGETAFAGKVRIQALLDEHRPVLVLVEIGGNDFLRKRPSSDVKGDIRALLKSTKQSGAQLP